MVVLVASHSDVSFLTPVGVPTVFAKPVFLSSLGFSITDDDYSVIHFGIAFWIKVEAGFVEHKRALSTINACGN